MIPFWEYSSLPPGLIAAGLFFMLLVCFGVAANIGLLLYWIKRPVRQAELSARLTARALPWQMVLIILGLIVGFFLLASWLYQLLAPQGGMEAQTVLFQTLFFHFPVLGLIGLLFHIAGIQGRELFGLHWKKAPALLGLSLIYYLAALPLLWFYSVIYQLFLTQFGHTLFMQEVAQVLTDPMSWPLRAALYFIVIVVAPVFEEIVFRGILLPAFVSRIGLLPGITCVSLLFAGLHWHLPSFLPLFLLSVMFCLAFARTRSLLVPLGMHAAFNGVTVIIILLTNQ